MKLTRTKRGNDGTSHDVLAIEGELDAFTASDLRKEIEPLIADKPREVLLDLSDLTMIDSSGVGVIVSLYKRLRAQGGELTIVGLGGQPQAVFEMLNRFLRGGRSAAATP